MTGSGKTTLLKNIITQDLMRRMGTTGGPSQDPHGNLRRQRATWRFFQELLPYIHRAGRLDDLRLINPARPELSSLYNPFYTVDDDYMAQVNMVFGILGLLCKTVIATLPAALLLIFWWKRGRLTWKQDVRPLVPFFLAGIGGRTVHRLV